MASYDLIIIGAGPAGLMAARTAAGDGLRVLLIEQRKKISRVRRYCSQLIRVGAGGYSSAKKPTDMEIRSVNVTFGIDHGRYMFRLHNLEDSVEIAYTGYLGAYYNETHVSPSGRSFDSDRSCEHIYGFQIDKDALIAGMLDEAAAAGCEVMGNARCTGLAEQARGVAVSITSGRGEETLQAGRVIIADGAFSKLVEKLGFNEGRPDGGPTLKFLNYILDRVDIPFREARHIKLYAPSVCPGPVNLGLWAHGAHQICMAVPVFTGVHLPELLDRVMKESPFSPWFEKSRVIDRLGCNMPLRPAIREPARGAVICCGDNAAFAETSIRGALGCGYTAAKASKQALQGGDGNSRYNDFWLHAFNFHSAQYRGFGKKIAPLAMVLDDAEVDTLFTWLGDNGLWGMPGDVLTDNIDRLRAALPDIAEKVIATGGSPGG